jgi:hypothetical protein
METVLLNAGIVIVAPSLPTLFRLAEETFLGHSVEPP